MPNYRPPVAFGPMEVLISSENLRNLGFSFGGNSHIWKHCQMLYKKFLTIRKVVFSNVSQYEKKMMSPFLPPEKKSKKPRINI